MKRVGACCAAMAILLVLPCAFTAAQAPAFDAVFERGTAQLKANDYRGAEESFLTATRMRPAYAPAYLNLGLALSQQNKQVDAVKALRNAVKLNPHLRGAALFLGIALFRINDNAQAAKTLKDATTIDPKDEKAWMWLGIVDLSAGQIERAAEALDKAAALDPNDVHIMFHRGRAHMLLAQQLYGNMLKADHQFWGVHEVLGQSYEEQGKDREAADEYRKAIELASTERGLHELYADVEWRLNELPAAAHAYAQETMLDPYNAGAYFKLGALQVLQLQPQEATASLKQALALSPKMYEAHYWMARAQELLGAEQEAMDQYIVAAQQAPMDDYDGLQSIWYHLAHLYGRQHRSEERAAALDKFQTYRKLATEKRDSGIERKKANQLGMDDSRDQK